MEVTIELVNNRLLMKSISKQRKRRTNSLKAINQFVDQLPAKPLLIEVLNNDIKIVYDNNSNLVLKNYKKNLNNQIYKRIFDGMDENIPVIKNIKVNRTKTLALTLATIALVSIGIVRRVNIDKDISSSVSISYQSNQDDFENTLGIENQITENNLLQSLDNYDFINRLNQTKDIINGKIENNSTIPLATSMDSYATTKLSNFVNSDDGKYCFDMCEQFGIDPYTFLCLMFCESSLNHEDTIPGGKFYNGFGVGICQLETPSGQEVTAFNYSTNQEETIYETMDNALDKKTNMKLGIMRYQKVLERYHGNEKLALQSYNYGYGLMDLIVSIYANEIGVSYDDVLNNYSDTGWLKYVKEVYENPQAFANKYSSYDDFKVTIDYLKNWQYKTYGNGDYLKNLYSYYVGMYSKNVVNGETVEVNLLDNTVTKQVESSNKSL